METKLLVKLLSSSQKNSLTWLAGLSTKWARKERENRLWPRERERGSCRSRRLWRRCRVAQFAFLSHFGPIVRSCTPARPGWAEGALAWRFLDFVHIFVRSSSELCHCFAAAAACLRPMARLCYPCNGSARFGRRGSSHFQLGSSGAKLH